ncbi:MAG: DoxX family protein [Candidatus Poribacteria bacterium]
MKITSLLFTLLRVFLGTILLLAGAAKVTEFRAFVGHVALYGILPMSLVTSASYLLVSAEITIGAALVLGYFSRGAGLLAALLFLTFALALASVLWRGLPFDECGCANILFDWLGLSEQPNWKAVFLDIILWMGSFFVARSPQQGYGVELLLRRVLYSGSFHKSV